MTMMGRPIPPEARQAGYELCKEIGLESTASWECVNGVANQLERDKPFCAQSIGMRHLDLTGTYRLLSTMLVKSLELHTAK